MVRQDTHTPELEYDYDHHSKSNDNNRVGFVLTSKISFFLRHLYNLPAINFGSLSQPFQPPRKTSHLISLDSEAREFCFSSQTLLSNYTLYLHVQDNSSQSQMVSYSYVRIHHIPKSTLARHTVDYADKPVPHHLMAPTRYPTRQHYGYRHC